MTTLERFVDAHVLSCVSSVDFITAVGSSIWHCDRKWRVMKSIYGKETKKSLITTDTIDELFALFIFDNDAKTLRDVLEMPYVLSVEFGRRNSEFTVDVFIASRDLNADRPRHSYVVMSESSKWHRISPLYALRRQIAIDSTPVDVWRSTMQHQGYDVRLVRDNETFTVFVYDINDADDDDRKPKQITYGKSPYEALLPWRLVVSDIAASEFDVE